MHAHACRFFPRHAFQWLQSVQMFLTSDKSGPTDRHCGIQKLHFQVNCLSKCPLSLRGGPLDILGGGVSDPKKKFMQGIELEKKIPASA